VLDAQPGGEESVQRWKGPAGPREPVRQPRAADLDLLERETHAAPLAVEIVDERVARIEPGGRTLERLAVDLRHAGNDTDGKERPSGTSEAPTQLTRRAETLRAVRAVRLLDRRAPRIFRSRRPAHGSSADHPSTNIERGAGPPVCLIVLLGLDLLPVDEYREDQRAEWVDSAEQVQVEGVADR
jgi:hypothetical protein